MKGYMKKIEEMMRLSIFEVFEKMFFIPLEPLSIEYDGYEMESSIKFSNHLSGELRLLVSLEIVKAMVENMLGMMADEITEQHMRDCSSEAVNMICGNFLSKLDEVSAFNLSIPSFSKNDLPLSPFKREPNEDIWRMDFGSDDGKVGMIVRLDSTGGGQ